MADYSYRSTSRSTGSDDMMDMANRAMNQAGDVADQVQRTADGAVRYVESSARNAPLMTLLVTAAVAFTLGALWRR